MPEPADDRLATAVEEAVRPWRARRATRAGEAVHELDRAILHTVTYAGLFESPLGLEELERSLLDVGADAPLIAERLGRPYLRRRLTVSGGQVHPAGRERWLAARETRRRHTRRLLERHGRFLRLLARFPFVRLVALSGACAHDNAADDDVDVFLVTRRGRAWAVALALTLLAKAAGVRRTLCLNYIVDEDAMALPERDVFTAFEIVGMKPLAGRSTYRRFVAANRWASGRFPNFFARHEVPCEPVPEVDCPRWLEAVLDLGAARLLEAASRRLLGAWLRRKGAGRPGVVLTPHRLKLHTHDHAPGLLEAFGHALHEAEGR